MDADSLGGEGEGVFNAVGAGPVKAVCGEGPELLQATNTRAHGQNRMFFLAVDWVRVL